jgi:hypothetical protein
MISKFEIMGELETHFERFIKKQNVKDILLN